MIHFARPTTPRCDPPPLLALVASASNTAVVRVVIKKRQGYESLQPLRWKSQ
jgi:hypothetical protein